MPTIVQPAIATIMLGRHTHPPVILTIIWEQCMQQNGEDEIVKSKFHFILFYFIFDDFFSLYDYFQFKHLQYIYVSFN